VLEQVLKGLSLVAGDRQDNLGLSISNLPNIDLDDASSILSLFSGFAVFMFLKALISNGFCLITA